MPWPTPPAGWMSMLEPLDGKLDNLRRRFCARGLEVAFVKQVSRNAAPVHCARAHVGHGREIVVERTHRRPYVRFAPLATGERALGGRRALGRGRHATEGNAHIGDLASLERDAERAAHRRNVLVEALGNLVRPQMPFRSA